MLHGLTWGIYIYIHIEGLKKHAHGLQQACLRACGTHAMCGMPTGCQMHAYGLQHALRSARDACLWAATGTPKGCQPPTHIARLRAATGMPTGCHANAFIACLRAATCMSMGCKMYSMPTGCWLHACVLQCACLRAAMCMPIYGKGWKCTPAGCAIIVILFLYLNIVG